MALIVQKFGGSSVRDYERIMNVARIVGKTYADGNDVAVVVSAQGDTTDDLLEKAAQITQHPNARELDVLLSTGEQISMALLSMALGEMGYPAISLTGWQAGFETNRSYGRARIKNLNTERLQSELDKRRIVIVAGFQGINVNDDITTLGRGGSDTSAVAIAAALNADKCQIYTDVDGIYTADPRIVANAQKLDIISFDEMLELATLGAQVLQNRSVELAKKYGVELEVLSSLDPVKGTIVREVVDMKEGMLIKGVTKDEKVAVITILDVPDVPGISFKVFSLVAQAKVNVDIILQATGRGGNKDIIFTVPAARAEEVCTLLRENLSRFGGREVEYSTDVAKVSVVGAGMQSHSGVASRMFEALYEANINIQMVATSEIKISVIVKKDEADRAVQVVHAAYEEMNGH
ncbi:aspartate kinase [Ruminococcaceae bacterium OttesenSCG-928-D13]|nr:aspartate kinase [Ruminococcaceae bacterium OttesenSCG-928-D13]